MSMMVAIPVLLLVAFLVYVMVRNSHIPGTKFMLLGISIILVGGIIAVDGNSDLGGFEYFIVLLGLILSVVGFAKK